MISAARSSLFADAQAASDGLEDKLHIMLQRTTANHELESLYVHEKLALVVIGSTGIDGSVTDFRLERVRMPEFDRIHRLHIVMSVHKDCRKRRINEFLTEHHRMSSSLIYSSLISTGILQKFDEPLRT